MRDDREWTHTGRTALGPDEKIITQPQLCPGFPCCSSCVPFTSPRKREVLSSLPEALLWSQPGPTEGRYEGSYSRMPCGHVCQSSSYSFQSQPNSDFLFSYKSKINAIFAYWKLELVQLGTDFVLQLSHRTDGLRLHFKNLQLIFFLFINFTETCEKWKTF